MAYSSFDKLRMRNKICLVLSLSKDGLRVKAP